MTETELKKFTIRLIESKEIGLGGRINTVDRKSVV